MSEIAPACPTCRRPVTGARDAHPFPFCSARCKLADLGHWLDGRYVVDSEIEFDESETPGARPPAEGE